MRYLSNSCSRKTQETSIAIIGGGISGLTAAYYLEQSKVPVSITLFEKERELGGKIKTTVEQGCTIEQGAESLFLRKPAILPLIDELGLRPKLIHPSERGFQIVKDGALYPAPLTLLSPYPHNLRSIWQSPLFSLNAKCAATLRPLLFRRLSSDQETEQSIAQYLRRKWGDETSRVLFETVYGGIYSGGAEQLSYQAIFGNSQEASGRTTQKNTTGKHSFGTFQGGTAQLISTLSAALCRTKIVRNCTVTEIQTEPNSEYTVVGQSTPPQLFDQIICTSPLFEAAKLFRKISPNLHQQLLAIRHGSSAVATLLVNSNDFRTELRGSGFLIPEHERTTVSGATFSSRKWVSRAPSGKTLLRLYFGGLAHGQPTLSFSDREILEMATEILTNLLHFHGTPEYERVHRWEDGLPQYELGHLSRVEQIERELKKHPGLYLTGAGLRGVGIPDCVHQAKEVVATVLQSIQLGKKGTLNDGITVRTGNS